MSELICVGGSFEDPRQIVPEIDGSGESMTEIALFMRRYGTIIIWVKLLGKILWSNVRTVRY